MSKPAKMFDVDSAGSRMLDGLELMHARTVGKAWMSHSCVVQQCAYHAKHSSFFSNAAAFCTLFFSEQTCTFL